MAIGEVFSSSKSCENAIKNPKFMRTFTFSKAAQRAKWSLCQSDSSPRALSLTPLV